MAVAAPARRSSAPATAPPPSRTSPPRRRKDGGAAPGRGKAAPQGSVAAPARPKAPSRAPARKAPARRPARRATPGQRVAAGGRLIPLAVGRTAVAVRELPDSGLVVRMTRGRAWIAVLGLLLVGIVTLNVVTLSFAASSSKVDERNTALEQENSALRSRLAQEEGAKKIRHAAAAQGLAMPTTEEPRVIEFKPTAVSEAAQRLAAGG
ncbi:MAG: hypothetical protein JST31_12400 [Actinobacteria bacterium]|nr:hypothetical protein [Actinomycetota bacterium]